MHCSLHAVRGSLVRTEFWRQRLQRLVRFSSGAANLSAAAAARRPLAEQAGGKQCLWPDFSGGDPIHHMSIAFIFPGQGSQAVGMGAELAKAYAPARAVFAEIDEALGQSLSTLIWVGPEDQLTLTENAQPALMAVSLAVIRVLEAEKG